MCAENAASAVAGEADGQDIAGAGISEFLGNHAGATPSYLEQPGQLDDRFSIDFNTPLAALSNINSKAYAAIDQGGKHHEVFALALSRQIPYRSTAIERSRQFRHPGYMNLVAAGPVLDPKKKVARLCLIHARPQGLTLAELMAQSPEQVNEKNAIKHWLPALLETVMALHRQGIAHNRINPGTVYIGEQVTLGECISEPAGFSQDFHFEAPEKILCHPAGHGHGDFAADYYALGALLAYILTGGRLFSQSDRAAFTHKLLNLGAYETLVGHREFSSQAEDFLRGTLNEKLYDRWGADQVLSWLEGKKFNLIRPSRPVEAPRPFSFAGQDFFNRNSIAFGLFSRWSSAQGVLRDTQLTRWLSLSAMQPNTARDIERVVKATGGSSRRSLGEDNELVAKTIIKLHPTGPICMQSVSAALDGIGTLLAYSTAHGQSEAVEQIKAMILNDLPNFWMQSQSTPVPEHFGRYLRHMEKLRQNAVNTELGFGDERFLYELNPSLPCQSPLLQSCHVLTLKELLQALDYLAPSLHQQHSLVDRHLAAFITSRLEISRPVSFNELESYPELVHHPKLVMLKMLAMVYDREKVKPLPGLTAWLAHMLPPLLEHLHSDGIRKKLTEKIRQVAETGNPVKLAEIMVSRDVMQNDRLGFKRAQAKYLFTVKKLAYLNDANILRRQSFQAGMRFCRSLSYLLLVLTVAMTIKEYL